MFWLVTVGVLATAAYVTYSRWNSLQVYAYALDAASWAAKWACSRVDNVKMLEVVFANGWMTSVLPNPVVDAEHTFMEMILKNFGSVGYPVTSVRLVVDVANEEHVLRFDHGQLQQKVSDVIGGIRKIAEDPEAALMTLEQHPVSATLKLVNGAEHNVTMAITKMLPGTFHSPGACVLTHNQAPSRDGTTTFTCTLRARF